MELERLRRENDGLRNELDAAKKQKKIPYLGCIIGGVVAVLFFFVIVPVIAAIALPMYSMFKQKSRVATVLRALDSTEIALRAWHEDSRGFDNVSLAPEGGLLKQDETAMGAGLPKVDGLRWSVEGQTNALAIHFNWDPNVGCPSENCDGTWVFDCSEGDCVVRVKVGEDNQLNFDR